MRNDFWPWVALVVIVVTTHAYHIAGAVSSVVRTVQRRDVENDPEPSIDDRTERLPATPRRIRDV